MSHGLHTQSQYLGPYHIRGQVIRTGDDQSCLSGIAANWSCSDHGRVAHGNGQVCREAVMHGSDKGMHILHKMMSFTLLRSRMTVIVSGRERHGNIFESQG